MDIHQWMGPKGIGAKYAEEKRKNPQSKDEMVTYQMALLSRKAGTNLGDAAGKKREAYIEELSRTGKLVAAGPFEGNGPLVEILILHNGPPEETAALVANHPGVKAGRLAFEIHPWWTAKGAMP
jgi:hypothetical protein